MARTRTTAGGPGKAGASSGTAGSGGNAALKFRNRAITVCRGTAVNRFGDRSNVGTVLYTGIPAALAEVTETVFDAATQRPQEVRSITCVVPNWADVIDSDTLLDEFTGFYYLVEGIEARPGIGYYPPDKLLSLKMRSGVKIASD